MQRLASFVLVAAVAAAGLVPRAASGQALASRVDAPGNRARLAADAVRRGEELRRHWDLDAAETAFREASARDPGSLGASLGLARIARARFEYAAALQLLDEAKRANPTSTELLTEYGSLYLAAEDPSRARAYFDRALAIDPACAAAGVGRAGADLLARDLPGAESRLRALLARDPENGRARALLARVLIEANQYAEAETEASRAVALDEYDTDALGALAFIKASRREPDEVRRLARRIVLLDPLSVNARRMLSQYLDGRSGPDQQVAAPARQHYERGKALRNEGHFAEALAEFEAALSVHPRYYLALTAVADNWLRDGDYERARTAARLALAVDSEGAAAHLELAYANRGVQERARIEIGGEDFVAKFYSRPPPPAYALTPVIFPNYRALSARQQRVIDIAVAPLAVYLPRLARKRARHYLLGFDETVGGQGGIANIGEDKTFDGRFYASLRGVGGRVTVSGLEYIEMSANGGFQTIAHEFAHQVHMTALGAAEVQAIRHLYEQAKSDGRTLDYYAAANDYEYFAQGYEAFVSEEKRPAAAATARHTRRELETRDPALFDFLMKLTHRRVP